MDIPTFINAVKINECIWNMKSVLYKDKDIKSKAWEGISGDVGVNVTKCIAKWKYLRDKYAREIRREKIYHVESRWPFYEQMNFLKESYDSKVKQYLPSVTTSVSLEDSSSIPIVIESSNTYKKSSENVEYDEDVLFGKQIVCKLKRLNNIQKSKVKIAILETFLQYECEAGHNY